MTPLNTFNRFSLQLIVLGVVLALTSVNATIPRGVSPVHASLYAQHSDGKWICLDNEKTLKHAQINDDYCDCADGSDEPGTSACSNGRFHCANIGYHQVDIQSSRVNDGICDCCDGSDEWNDGTTTCKDSCLDRARFEEEQLRVKEELHQKGSAKRSEMIARGKQLRAEREARRQILLRERNDQEAIKAEKEELKRNAEAAEAEAVEFYKEQQRHADAVKAVNDNDQKHFQDAEAAFKNYDKNNDGFVDKHELMVDLIFDRDRNGVVTIEEVKYFLDNGEKIDLDAFCILSWPRIKPLKTLNEDIFKPPNTTGDDEKVQHLTQSNPSKVQGEHEQDESKEGSDESEIYEEENDASPSPAEIEYDPETQRLIDLSNEARKVYAEAVQKVRQIEQEIKNIDDQLAKDYGPNEEFAVLDGECFAYEDREYIYELCPFNRAVQKARSGALETILGRWYQWIVGDDKKYAKQKYAHGAACWNGPKRTCIVQFVCGLEQRILSVAEPNRCEYNYVFETPAACADNVLANAQRHEEL